MRPLAYFCFFLSGASGLIFQVIWVRHFSLVFGATSLAISTVLTAFMGGLALGSYACSRWADNLRTPLKLYALAEAGIGISALLLPLVVSRFDGINQYLYQNFQDNYLILAACRFLLSSVVIVVPTTLMGATLPLLARYFISNDAEHRRIGLRVGVLYAINTAGAVLGASMGGFVLLPSLGLHRTNVLAAGCNLVLAVLVLVGHKVSSKRQERTPVLAEDVELLQEIKSTPVADVKIAPGAPRIALIAFAISGAAAMIYQVIWSRALAMTIGSSVYSFTIVLAAFLIGLAAGAAIIGRLAARSSNPVGMLCLNHLVIVVCVALSYLWIDDLGDLFVFMMRGHRLSATTVIWRQFTVALVCLLPATLAMGGTFPLTIRICAQTVKTVGRDVGRIYSINTVGAIVGSFAAGFVVMPIFQLQGGLYVAVLLNLSLAAVLALWANWQPRWRYGVVALSVISVFVLPLLPRWNLYRLSEGVFRPRVARDAMSADWEEPELVYYRDGMSTTVTVEKWSEKHFSLKNNGKVDASTGDDMPTQIAVGLLPILLHPRAPELKADVALIGYASGVTAGAALQYPLRRLDVVELEPAILKAADFFNHVNNQPRKDPRLHLRTDDGRNFLAAGSSLYDVIINEPSNPWITGVSNLFTREYFAIAKKRLKDDGVFCTWAQMYELSPRRIKSIYRSFASVFPHAYAFSADTLSSDTFLVGSRKPLNLDLKRLRRAYANKSIAKEMKRGKLETPHDILAMTLLAPGEIAAYTVGARPNTDDNAIVEFAAPRDLYNHKRFDYYISSIYGQQWLYGRLEDFVSGYDNKEDFGELIPRLLRQGKLRESRYFLAKTNPKAGPHSLLAHQFLALLNQDADAQVSLTQAGEPLADPIYPKKLAPSERDKRQTAYERSVDLASRFHYQAALDIIEAWPVKDRESAGVDFQLYWGFLNFSTGHYTAARNILSALMDEKRPAIRRPALLYFLGLCYFECGNYADALETFRRWIDARNAAGRPPVPEKDDECFLCPSATPLTDEEIAADENAGVEPKADKPTSR
jgi:spermidine synthase